MKRVMISTAIALGAMALSGGAWAKRYRVEEVPLKRTLGTEVGVTAMAMNNVGGVAVDYCRVTAHAVNDRGQSVVGEFSWNDAAEVCSPTFCR